MMELFKNPTLWVAVSFVIFIGLALKMGVSNAITGALDGHAKKIAADLAEAKRLRNEAEALLAVYEAKRKAAQAEAAEIIKAANAQAEALAKEAEAKITDFITRRTKAVETKIAQAEAQATTEVRAAAADAAASAAEQIIRGKLAGKAGADLLASSLRDVKAKLN